MRASPLIVLILAAFANSDVDTHKRRMSKNVQPKIGTINEEELTADYWNTAAQKFLDAKLRIQPNTNQAKNVIFFLGDGMSIPTLKAARVYQGQLNGTTGEEGTLFFEDFPYSALSRTYCVDVQVPDSACTATAYLCGVKTNYETAGVTASVALADCAASLKEENRVDSIGRWFQLAGKKAGLVTTTRVTHATPSGIYAHTAHRSWECDVPSYDDTPPMPEDCEDIAVQLITGETGRNLNVIMGGGRRMLLPQETVDEENDKGTRTDERNLIVEWLAEKEEGGLNAQYIWSRSELRNLSDDTEYVLGIFESDHCKYHLDANDEDPSLEEMTEVAINVLSKGDKGFFLLVEGGRIDTAHHDNWSKKALDETVEFSKAIKKAYEMTSDEDTLIVVTADHAHVFSVSGYPDRGNDILGIAGIADDDKVYTTLSYANGPGYKEHGIDGRPDISADSLDNNNYRFPAMAPLEDETHGGDDVAIFASGPWAHLFTGSVEQNYIPHAMAFASCVGEGQTVCQYGRTIKTCVSEEGCPVCTAEDNLNAYPTKKTRHVFLRGQTFGQ